MEKLNYEKLDKIINDYKQNFEEHRKHEIYKWKAVKTFQDNWDIEASDFARMLKQSLKDSANLLSSGMYFPKAMIIRFAEKEAETTRKMFRNLFDESIELKIRYQQFVNMANELLAKYWEEGKNHYQDAHTISTYLTFRYPDKYYLYKSLIDNTIANFLDAKIFNRDKEKELENYFALCDKVLEYIKKDDELLKLSQRSLTTEHYQDGKFHILTWDLLFYGGRIVRPPKSLSIERIGRIGKRGEKFVVEKEKKFMQFYEWLKSNTSLKESSIQHYCSALKIIEKEFSINIESVRNYEELKYIENLLESNPDFKDKNNKGNHMYSAALSQYEKYLLSMTRSSEMQYFWLSANPKIWSYSKLNIGEVIEYTSENENGNKRKIYRNFGEARKGDMVIGYEATPTKAIVAVCKVEEALNNGILKIKKIRNLSNVVPYEKIIKLKEMENSEATRYTRGSLFKLTKTEYDSLMELIEEYNDETTYVSKEQDNPKIIYKPKEPYSKKDFLNEVYISEECYDEMVQLLKRKKNIILQGPPGVGKSFMAKRLVYSIMNEKDNDRVKCIQFHQSYSYEDFIEGWRPTKKSYELEQGIFYDFCKTARDDKSNKDYFFLIDEINRGNLSKIFGELLMLIENDKRGEELNLAYSKKPFSVPDNVYIIGMMNTADRSLAIIDYALRRRFAFCPIDPAFENEQFKQYLAEINDSKFNQLIERIKQLNVEIEQDPTLGTGFKIGHSYFCNLKDITEDKIESIIKYEILPLLEEYWFDDTDKYKSWLKKLNEVVGVVNG